MSRRQGDGPIIGLVLMASAAVLAAPILGRLGASSPADWAMWTAAGCGVAAFVLAGRATLQAARNPGRRGSEER